MNKKIFETALKSDLPIILWGPPGCGKTAMITSMAKDKKAHLEVIIGSQIDPSDLERPMIKNGEYELSPAPWARRIKKALENSQEAWLFLDELSAASPSVQACLLRVVHDRVVGGLDIKGCKIIAASNPSNSSAGSGWLATPMANRFVHIDYIVETSEWCSGLLSGWGKIDKTQFSSRALVSSWIEHRPEMLCPEPPEKEETKGYPSPRSWEGVSRILAHLDSDPIKAAISKEGRSLIYGLVGKGEGMEFCSWVSEQDIPNPEDILSGKEKIPSRGDKASVCLNSVLSLSIHTNRLKEFFILLNQTRKDVAVLSARQAARAAEKANIELPEESKEIIQLIRNMN